MGRSIILPVLTLVLASGYSGWGGMDISAASSANQPQAPTRSPDGTLTFSGDRPQCVPDEIIYQLKDDGETSRTGTSSTIGLQQQLAGRYEFQEIKPLLGTNHKGPLARAFRVRLAKGKRAADVCERMRTDSAVVWAEPNYYRYTAEESVGDAQNSGTSDAVALPERKSLDTGAMTPNDPYYTYQSHLWSIKAQAAWDMTTGGTETVIAVIDTGVDWHHQDLAANIWVNTGEVDGDGIDNDGNGFVDDVRGWDFVNTNPEDVYPGEDPGPPDNDPMDFYGHGTHVAGIAAAAGNNGVGVTGVSWHGRIMPLRAGYKHKYGAGYLESADIVAALVYAAENGADIINMSFGAPNASIAERIAMDYAMSRGCLLVAAAGNDRADWPFFPAAFNRVLSVAALEDGSNAKAGFSNYGLWVDVAAPGMSIYSTLIGDKYGSMSGTSMACPIVAGVASLVKSAHPDWSADQVSDQIIATARDIDAGNPFFAGRLGAGLVDAEAAVGPEFAGRYLKVVSTLARDTGGDDDDELEAGESVSLYITLKNFSADQPDISVVLSSSDPYIEIIRAVADYGTLARHRTVTNMTAPFIFHIAENVPSDHLAKLKFEVLVGGMAVTCQSLDLPLAPSWRPPQVMRPNNLFEQLVRVMQDGRIMAIMDSDAAPKQGIFAMIRESNGAWSTAQRISGEAGNSHDPAMDLGPDGDVHVVFNRNVGICDSELAYARFDASNNTWMAEEQLTTGADIFCETPAVRYGSNYVVSADSAGLVHVVWMDYRSGNPLIYYKYNDGTGWRAETPINDLGSDLGNDLFFSMFDLSDGRRFLFYRKASQYYVMPGIGTEWDLPHTVTGFYAQGMPFQNGDEIYLLYNTSSSSVTEMARFDGTDWKRIETLIDLPMGSRIGSLGLAPDGGKRFAAQRYAYDTCWIDWMFTSSPGTWSPAMPLTGVDMYVTAPLLAVAPDGTDHILYLTWEPMGGGWFYRPRSSYLADGPRDAGLLPSRPVVIDDGATTSDDRHLHVSWTTSHPAGVAFCQYAVGTAPGKADTIYWTDEQAATADLTRDMAARPLLRDQPYYVSVRSYSNAVYSSALGHSDGMIYQPVGLPDLKVTGVTVPAYASPNAPVAVFHELRNDGDVPAASPWHDQYYLSPSPRISRNNVPLSAVLGPIPLAPQKSTIQAAEITVPVGFFGDYYISVVADNDFALDELDETNNAAVAAHVITIAPPPAVAVPFEDDFDTPGIKPGWSFFSSGLGRLRVEGSSTPCDSGRRLVFDVPSGEGLNEAVLTLDLEGRSNLVLRFWQRDFGDEEYPIPTISWKHQVRGNGVSISQDGVTWYPVVNLAFEKSLRQDQWHTVDLDEAVLQAGISYDHDFHVKFQQFASYDAVPNGFTIDDVQVYSVSRPLLTSAVSWKGHGRGGDYGLYLLKPPDPQDAMPRPSCPNMAVECRAGDNAMIEVTFHRSIQGVGGLDPSDVSVSNGMVSALTIDQNELIVELVGVSDARCLTMAFPGIEDQAGNTATDVLHAGILLGDVNGDGGVNVFDLLVVRNSLIQSLSDSTFLADVTRDGRINVFDLLAVRNNINKTISSCP